MSNIFQLDDAIAWEELGNGISRKILGFNTHLMLVKVKFEKGAVGSLHQHVHSQASYIESGVFELSIGDHKKVLKPGDGYFIPPNEIHGCICLESGIILDTFSPIRQDFIS